MVQGAVVVQGGGEQRLGRVAAANAGGLWCRGLWVRGAGGGGEGHTIATYTHPRRYMYRTKNNI